jgi:hypothetical protein
VTEAFSSTCGRRQDKWLLYVGMICMPVPVFPSRRVPLAGLRCAISPGPRLKLLGLSRVPCVGLGFLVRLRFALHGFAVWCVCAIAPSLNSGWRAFSSVFLCQSICIPLRGVFVRLRLASFPAGRPFLPSLYVNLYSCSYLLSTNWGRAVQVHTASGTFIQIFSRV